MAEIGEKCTMCGEETDDITFVDDETCVCPDCLEEEFFYCEECCEHGFCNAVDAVELDDGRTVCESCAEETE